jgi:hypothetical protein
MPDIINESSKNKEYALNYTKQNAIALVIGTVTLLIAIGSIIW